VESPALSAISTANLHSTTGEGTTGKGDREGTTGAACFVSLRSLNDREKSGA